jgi:Sec-independent protein translocase protein TatA
MNILGVGGWELVLIVVIMLIVAGPKRMARWAYVAGTYIAKFRAMWAETVDVLQKEFDDAGVGIQIPKDIPTRGSINKQAAKVVEEFTRPVKETMDKATADIGEIKKATAVTAQAASKTTNGVKPAAASANNTKNKSDEPKSNSDFGTWSGGSSGEFGTWSGDKE